MNGRAVIAGLLAGLFLAGLFSTLVATIGDASSDDVASMSMHVDNDRSAGRSHKMTLQEMQNLKSVLGVRDPNKNYNILIDGYGTGLAPPTEDEWGQLVGEVVVVDEVPPAPMDLNASYDLSSLPTFPIVGNQRSQGSCAAWAATYYTYGFLESADNEWTDAHLGVASHLISPAWTYNKVNGGRDRGSWMGTNMAIVRDWGAATLATMPYDDSDPVSWGSQAAFREAPLHRSNDVYYITYSGQATVDAVKSLVSSGIPVTFAMDANQFAPGFSDGNYILSATEYSSPGLNHAQTFVGYNDAISDDGEVGAFRVVNSWSAGWGDHGFYWLTYAAFKEIGSNNMLFLTYLQDKPDYVPSLLAAWHFNNAPTRFSDPEVGIGPYSSPVQSRTPYFEHDASHTLPTFMCLDISEFKADYDAGVRDFYLALGPTVGTISSFKLELYEGVYVPGAATQASGQSSMVPKATPGFVTNTFPYYSPIQPDDAVDMPSLIFTSSTYVTWVGVNHHSHVGGSSMQSGDVGDDWSTQTKTTVSGPLDIWFDWKVSSEQAKDVLSFRVDSVPLASISGEVDWQTEHFVLAAGAHVLTWEYSKDSATSTGADSGWIDNIVVDAKPPFTFAEVNGIPGHNGWYRSGVTVILSAYDTGGSGVLYTTYQIDSATWQTYTSQLLVTGNGQHTLDYYSVDKVGNIETTRHMDIHIDGALPRTDMILYGTLGSNYWYVSAVDVSLRPWDGDSGLEMTRYRVDGGDWAKYDGTFQIASEGLHKLEYQSHDIAGNTEPMKSSVVRIDLTGPSTIAMFSGVLGENSWYTTDVEVSLLGSDATSMVNSIQYRLDGSLWRAYSVPLKVSTNGLHVVEFYSQDLAGNKETVRTDTFKVDKSPPNLELDKTDGLYFRSKSVSVNWSSSDDMSGIDHMETSLDGAPFVNRGSATYSLQLTQLSEGSHRLAVRSTDKAGLSSEKTLQFFVDTLPPVTSHTASGALGKNGWHVSTVVLTLKAMDATAGVGSTYYSADDGQWQIFSVPFSMSSPGLHTIRFYSRDRIGNVEGIKSTQVMIDFVAPDLNIMSPDGDTLQSQVTVAWNAADSTSGLDYCDVSVDGASFVRFDGSDSTTFDLSRGSHVVVVRATDLAGNVAERELEFSVGETGAFGESLVAYSLYALGVLAVVLTTVMLLVLIRKRRESAETKKPTSRNLPPPP